MKGEKERSLAIDGLRVVAITAVVAIHTSTRLLEEVNFDLSRGGTAFWVNQISRFAVPIFFMVSGAALEISFSNQNNYFNYLKKRIVKIVVPQPELLTARLYAFIFLFFSRYLSLDFNAYIRRFGSAFFLASAY